MNLGLYKIIQLVSGRAGIWTQAICFRMHINYSILLTFHKVWFLKERGGYNFNVFIHLLNLVLCWANTATLLSLLGETYKKLRKHISKNQRHMCYQENEPRWYSREWLFSWERPLQEMIFEPRLECQEQVHRMKFWIFQLDRTAQTRTWFGVEPGK